MFHDLRTFFDAEYRLHMVRLELRKLLAKTKLSLSDLFDKVDVDGSMVINRDELKALIELAGCHVKDMEVDFLMSKIDGDGSGDDADGLDDSDPSMRLPPEQAAKLLVLITHARTCPGHHVNRAHSEVRYAFFFFSLSLSVRSFVR